MTAPPKSRPPKHREDRPAGVLVVAPLIGLATWFALIHLAIIIF